MQSKKIEKHSHIVYYLTEECWIMKWTFEIDIQNYSESKMGFHLIPICSGSELH